MLVLVGCPQSGDVSTGAEKATPPTAESVQSPGQKNGLETPEASLSEDAVDLTAQPEPADRNRQLYGEPDYMEDFEGLFRPSTVQDSGNWSLAGEFPEGWQIRTIYPSAEYSGEVKRLTGNVAGGEAAFGFGAAHLNNTFLDLIPDRQFPSDRYLKVRVAVRSPDTARMDLGLIRAGEVGRLVWKETRVYVPAEWMQREFIIPPQDTEAGGQPLQLVFRAGIPPSFIELDNLEVWVLEGEDLNAGIPAAPDNLLPQSGFPFGLPTGWSIGQVGGSDLVQVDAEELSPLGRPSLEIKKGARFLNTPSFQAHGGRMATISFYAKGSVPGQSVRVELMAPPLSEMQRMTLSPEWQHYRQTIRMPYPLDGFQTLKIYSGQSYWIDGLMIEEGTDFTEFKQGFPVEQHLRHEDYYGLVDVGQPIEIQLGLSGDLSAVDSIRGAVEDVYGNMYPWGPIPLSPEATGSTAMMQLPLEELLAEALPKLGTYRVESRAYDAEGQPVSAWGEIIVHRILTARHADAFAVDSAFGAHIAPSKEQPKMAKRLGFNWARMHDAASGLKWYYVEGNKGTYDFARGDREVAAFHDAKINVLGVLDTSPIWASNVTDEKPRGRYNYYWDAKWMPKDFPAWRQYCREITRHFKGRVDQWEIWNEPYVGLFFSRDWDPVKKRKVKGTPEDYHQLASEAVAGGMSGNSEASFFLATKSGEWIRSFAENDTLRIGDGLTFHSYSPQHMAYDGDEIDAFSSDLRAHAQGTRMEGKPIWNTEGGLGAAPQHFYKHMEPSSHSWIAMDQASGLVRYYLSNLIHGVDKFFLYSFHGSSHWAPSWVIMAYDDTLPPHASALSHFFWQLEDLKLAGQADVPGGSVYLFEGRRNVAVVIPEIGASEPIKRDWGAFKVYDLFGNPYQADRVGSDWPFFIPYAPEAKPALGDILRSGAEAE